MVFVTVLWCNKTKIADETGILVFVRVFLSKKSSTLPDCTSSDDLANEFCEFFTAKVEKISNKVDSICSASVVNVTQDSR